MNIHPICYFDMTDKELKFMNKKYYKVVRCNKDGTYSSARQHSLLRVKYKLGEWTEAKKNTRLFVFDSLAKAKHFCLSGDEAIFECEISDGIKGRGCNWGSDKYNFWQLFNIMLEEQKKVNFKKIQDSIELNKVQAVLAKKVKLTKLIQDKEKY